MALFALFGRTDGEKATKEGFTYTIPSRWFDLQRMGELEIRFGELGIRYGKNDVYPAFKSKEELNGALLKVYESGWKDRWSIEDYLVEEGLIADFSMLPSPDFRIQ